MSLLVKRTLAVLALTLAGCKCSDKKAPPPVTAEGPSKAWLDGTPEADTATPHDGGALVVRAMVEPGGLNYLANEFRDGWTNRITRNNVFECLIEIDAADYSLKPQLATSWTESDDHLTQTFHLREGVKFHDGSPFTAADVIAVFDAVKNAKLPTDEVRADFSDLDSYKTIDAHTVELHWKKVSFLSLRQVAKLPIYPAKALEGDWDKLALNRSPIGTGPFKLSHWDAGQKLELSRFDGYWGPRPHLDAITFRFVKDHTLAAALAEKGELDLFTQVQPTVWRAIEAATPENRWAQTGFNRIRAPENAYSYLAWNEAFAPFADPKVRHALSRAYPAELIAQRVDMGLELPTTCPFFLGSPHCDPMVKPLTFDPAAARAELEAAGYKDADSDGVLERDGQALRFKLLIPATSVRMGKLVPLLQEELKKAGVALEPDKADPAVIDSRIDKRDFDAVAQGWTEFDSEQDLFQTFHSSQAKSGANYPGLKDAELDKLLEDIRAELDPKKRLELEHAVHRRVYELQPYTFMSVRQTLDLAKKRVHGLKPSLVWYDLKQVWVDPQP